MGKLNSDVLTAMYKVVNTAKAEAYDEFARIAKCVFSKDTHKAIDQIAKELKEELK